MDVGCLLRSLVQCLALSYASTEITDADVTDMAAASAPVKTKDIVAEISNI